MLPQAQKQRGFTIVELMIVVVIAAILATLAGPSFTSFIANTRQNSAFSQLQGDLNRARSEAIKRNAHVLVCNSTTGTTCSAATDWSAGWIVCYDVDASGDCDVGTATDPNPFVVRGALHNTLALNVSATPIRFNATGTQGVAGAVTLTLAGGTQNKTLTVSATGNIAR